MRPYGFPKETPINLPEDSDGGIWIATQGTDASAEIGRGGLYRYWTGHLEEVLSGDGLTVVALSPGIMLGLMGTETSDKQTLGDLYVVRESESSWAARMLLEKQVDHLFVDHQGNLLFHEFPAQSRNDLRFMGVGVKIAQELLRHSNSRTTMDIYTQAVSSDKRIANGR